MTPVAYELDVSYTDKFSEIARNYLKPGFIFDVASTLTLLFNYAYRWMYYLKYLRAYYFPRAMGILHKAIDPVVTWCKISKQAKGNVQSIFSQFIILFTIMHMIACGWILV